MRKTGTRALACVLATAIGRSAVADEVEVLPPTQPWTGLYVSATAGAWLEELWFVRAEAGYLFQTGRVVFGIGTAAGIGFAPGLATSVWEVSGRLGVSLGGDFLVYGRLGRGWLGTGWSFLSLGAGAEMTLTDSWSAKLEVAFVRSEGGPEAGVLVGLSWRPDR